MAIQAYLVATSEYTDHAAISPISIIFSCVVVVWAAAMMDQWQYTSQYSSLVWGTANINDDADDRPEFADDDDVLKVLGTRCHTLTLTQMMC